MKRNWNTAFNLVMEIKEKYQQQFNDGILDLQLWIEKLNEQKYLDFLQGVTITKYNQFALIKYSMVLAEDLWTNPNSVYRECRSVVIDLDKEQLVTTPFPKFFNLDEIPENKFNIVAEEVEHGTSIEISNKLDGSMQPARYYEGNIFMTGSQSMDINNSWRLKDGYSKLTDNHKKMIIENDYLTFTFEYISLMDSHVVKYTKEQEGMYLIGIRDVTNGRQYSYKEIKQYADKYNVPMTQIENRTFDEILNDAKKVRSDEKEGWVINIDGHMIKLKCDDYVQIHKILSKVSSVNVVIKNIADNTFDDLISKVPDLYRPRVMDTAKEVLAYVSGTELKIMKYYQEAPKDNIKNFMIWVDKNCSIELRGYIKNKYLNKPYNLLKNGNEKNPSYKKASEIGLNSSLIELID